MTFRFHLKTSQTQCECCQLSAYHNLRAITDILLYITAAPARLSLDAFNTILLKCFSFSASPVFSITSANSSAERTHLLSLAVRVHKILHSRGFQTETQDSNANAILVTAFENWEKRPQSQLRTAQAFSDLTYTSFQKPAIYGASQ